MLKLKSKTPRPRGSMTSVDPIQNHQTSFLSTQHITSAPRTINEKHLSSKKKTVVVVESNLLRPIRLSDGNKSKTPFAPVVLQQESNDFVIENETQNFEDCKSLVLCTYLICTNCVLQEMHM